VIALTSADAFDVATDLRQCALALGDWRLARAAELPAATWDQLDDQEITLLNAASDLYTTAVGLVLDESLAPVKRLRASLQSARNAIRALASARHALKIVAQLLLLAAALSAGGRAAIATALVGLEEAVGVAGQA
jgi:hypothetical protein